MAKKAKSRAAVVRSTVSDWTESAKDKAHQVHDKWVELQHDTKDLIKENPMSATLIAFGVGVVAGAIMVKMLEKKE